MFKENNYKKTMFLKMKMNKDTDQNIPNARICLSFIERAFIQIEKRPKMNSVLCMSIFFYIL